MLEHFAEKLRKAEEETPPRPICPPVPTRKPSLVADMAYPARHARRGRVSPD